MKRYLVILLALIFVISYCELTWGEQSKTLWGGKPFGGNIFEDTNCNDSPNWDLDEGWSYDSTNEYVTKSYLTYASGKASYPIIHPGGGIYWLAYSIVGRTSGSVTPTIGDSTGVGSYTNTDNIVKLTPTSGGNLEFLASPNFNGAIDQVYVTPTRITSTSYQRSEIGDLFSLQYNLPLGGPITATYYLSNDDSTYAATTIQSITDTTGSTSNGEGMTAFSPIVSKYVKFGLNHSSYNRLSAGVPEFTATVTGIDILGNSILTVERVTVTDNIYSMSTSISDDGNWDGEAVTLGKAPYDAGMNIVAIIGQVSYTEYATVSYNVFQVASGALTETRTPVFTTFTETDTNGVEVTSFSDGTVPTNYSLLFATHPTEATHTDRSPAFVNVTVYYKRTAP